MLHSEMSAAGMGMDITTVCPRQQDMEPFEIWPANPKSACSWWSQGRGRGQGIFEKWDLHAEYIGEVTEGDRIRYFMNGELVGDVPGSTLCWGRGACV